VLCICALARKLDVDLNLRAAVRVNDHGPMLSALRAADEAGPPSRQRHAARDGTAHGVGPRQVVPTTVTG
jgi:hypothetical protein